MRGLYGALGGGAEDCFGVESVEEEEKNGAGEGTDPVGFGLLETEGAGGLVVDGVVLGEEGDGALLVEKVDTRIDIWF